MAVHRLPERTAIFQYEADALDTVQFQPGAHAIERRVDRLVQLELFVDQPLGGRELTLDRPFVG